MIDVLQDQSKKVMQRKRQEVKIDGESSYCGSIMERNTKHDYQPAEDVEDTCDP